MIITAFQIDLTVANRHALVSCRGIAIDRDAEWSANFVLSTITTTNRSLLIILNAQAGGFQIAVDFGRLSPACLPF
jgi:hypothetical protein